MKKIKIFIIILSWQIIGLVAALIVSLPLGDFHHFVHELILCLTFTNLVGLSALTAYGLYRRLRHSRMSKTMTVVIPVLLFVLCAWASLKASMNLGGFICGLDDYHVNRWHLSILVVDFTLMAVLIILAVLMSLYRQIASRLENKIRENESLTRLQVEARLSLLQSKINPHFLFNTLNTMLDVLQRDPAKVEKIILNLSDIYRKTLTLPDHLLVPLQEEITLVNEYLEIEKVRMGDRLRFSLDVEDQLKKTGVPPMMLQMLVENAVKHGLTPKKEGGEIRVNISRHGNEVILEVTDSGVGMDPSTESRGFGLASIRQRLKMMYQNARMDISPITQGGTRIRILIPDAA